MSFWKLYWLFFLILVFYDFLQLSERGSNEKQVAKKGKKKENGTHHLSGWAIPTLPTSPFFWLSSLFYL
jgi:hypothetical protein